MIKVDYQFKNKLGQWKSGFSLFYDCKKASRFIHKIWRDAKYIYQGYSCNDCDELDEMQHLTSTLKF